MVAWFYSSRIAVLAFVYSDSKGGSRVKSGGISGLAVAMVVVGGLLMYAAIKNYTLLDTARYALSGGRGPSPQPRPPINTGITPTAPGGPSTGLTGTARSNNPDAGIGSSSTRLPSSTQLPTPGFNKPLP
jgi:hypothetical protein